MSRDSLVFSNLKDSAFQETTAYSVFNELGLMKLEDVVKYATVTQAHTSFK